MAMGTSATRRTLTAIAATDIPTRATGTVIRAMAIRHTATRIPVMDIRIPGTDTQITIDTMIVGADMIVNVDATGIGMSVAIARMKTTDSRNGR
jgi:hypothetical protein